MNSADIFLISANDTLRSFVAKSLADAGLAVVQTNKAADAAKLLTECGARLAILDSSLPGAVAPKLLRQFKESPDLPVVVLSEPAEESLTESAGATAFVNPPVDRTSLVDLIKSLLESDVRRALLEAGLAQLVEGQHETATQLLKEVAGEAPSTPTAYWALYHAGRALVASGQANAAAAEFHGLLVKNPSFWRAHIKIGDLLAEAGFLKEPLDFYRHAVQLNPRLPRVLKKIEDLETALVASEEAARLGVAAPASGAQPAAKGMDILLADDSELALDMVGACLREAGYNVRTALSGREALAVAQEKRPDLVILDGLMPGASGFEVCKQLRETVFPDDPPPIIILSAVYTKRAQKAEAMQVYGASDLIPKSTDDAVLLAAVQSHLGPGQAQSAG